jgi:hypothetical protein
MGLLSHTVTHGRCMSTDTGECTDEKLSAVPVDFELPGSLFD